jgi:uncharacterized membrane protein YdfJ with MMPL/SSD domain
MDADGSFDVKIAVSNMMATSGRTVLFSAVLLMTTLSGALQFNMYYLTSLSLTIIFIAAFAAIGSMTFIPAFYLWFGKRIFMWSADPFKCWCYNHMSNVKSFILVAICGKNNKLENSENGVVGNVINDDEIYDMEDSPLPKKRSASPQLTFQYDNFTDATKFTFFSNLATDEDKKDPWFIVTSYVVKYPWGFLLAITACFVALTAVFITDVRMAGFSWAVLPLDSYFRYTYETLLYDFSSTGKSNIEIFIQLKNPLSYGMDSSFVIAMDDFCTELESYNFVTSVNSMVRVDSTLNITDYIRIYSDPDNPTNYNYSAPVRDPFFFSNIHDVASVTFGMTLSPSDPKLGQSVRGVRELLKKSFKNMDGSSMLVLSGVGGSGASEYDTLDDIRSTLPNFIAVVVCTMFFFIMMLTGSIILPLKTIMISFLSIAGSFAFLMFVFQNNDGADFLQFNNNFNSLDPIQLLFIFVVSFGLSLDYEVFIMGRIQEIYENTGDNNYATAKGVSSSARSVTIAAILICTAIGGFLSSKSIILKMIGMGIGLTIVIDATVVRCILIPSAMVTLGDYTWYAPAPIKKFVKYFGLEERSNFQ